MSEENFLTPKAKGTRGHPIGPRHNERNEKGQFKRTRRAGGAVKNFNGTKHPYRVFWNRRALRPEDRWVKAIVTEHAASILSDKPDVSESEKRVVELAAMARGCSSLILDAMREAGGVGTDRGLALMRELKGFMNAEQKALRALGLNRRARVIDPLEALAQKIETSKLEAGRDSKSTFDVDAVVTRADNFTTLPSPDAPSATPDDDAQAASPSAPLTSAQSAAVEAVVASLRPPGGAPSEAMKREAIAAFSAPGDTEADALARARAAIDEAVHTEIRAATEVARGNVVDTIESHADASLVDAAAYEAIQRGDETSES